MKKRKSVFISVLIVFITVAIVVLYQSKQKNKRPDFDLSDMNLLIITLDTTRADHIGCYGNPHANTPNIDSLASDGISFKYCYTPVPLTFPAHCSLFTGKYPVGLNVRNNGLYVLHQDELTLAEFFKNKGYSNYAVIASYVLGSKFGLAQGFDIYDDSLNPPANMLLAFDSEIPANLVYARFNKWLENNNNERFFAWVHFFDPHLPYEPPEQYAKKESDPVIRYNGEIAYTDHYIGKIVDDLRKKNALDETLIIIVGDHGEAFGEHLEYGHGVFCYEEVLKVPLIFFNKKIFKKQQVIENRVSLVDIFPTIADLYRDNIPEGIQGKSFTRFFMEDFEKQEQMIYFESMYGKEENNWAPLMGIIDQQMKYISLPQPELYDLKSDPLEKINIIKKNSSIYKSFDTKLKEFLLTNSSAKKETKRKLSKEDIAHLQSLGYISKVSKKSSLEIDPKTGIILIGKLEIIYKKITEGFYDEAEEELKAMLSNDTIPRHPLIYNWLDIIYVHRKDRDAWLNNLLEGLKIFPNCYELNFRLITRLYENREYDKAIYYSKQALKRNPFLTHAYITLSEIYYLRQQFEEAVVYYKKAAELEPENEELNFKFAKLLLMLRRMDEALPIYEKLSRSETFSNNHEFLYWFALYHFSYGDNVRAEELIKKAINLNANGNYYFYYALILVKSNKYQQAIQKMKIASEKYPHHLSERQRRDAVNAISLWKTKVYQ